MSVNTNASFNAGMPIGSLVEFAGTTAPNGWALCQGQALNRTEYSELFAVIGTTYGAGNGSTTFNVPDMRDRIPIGKTSNGSLGTKAGSKTATLAIANMPSHRHSMEAIPDHYHTVPGVGISEDAIINPSNPDYGKYYAAPLYSGDYARFAFGDVTLRTHYQGNVSGNIGTSWAGGRAATNTGYSGGGQAFSIMPPTITVNYLIKVK